MKRTLLRVVQDVSRYLSGFNVDSIWDTDESRDIAYIAEKVYYNIVQRYNNIDFTGAVGTLESYGDPAFPTYMRIPGSVQRVQDSLVQYNVAKGTDSTSVNYKTIQYLDPVDFLHRMNRSTGMPNTAVINDPSGVEFVIGTKEAPSYCTSFDSEVIVFDSYDSEEDTTLQQTKTRVYFTEEEVFLLQDAFVIPMPSSLSEMYLDLVISECSMVLRQEASPETMRRGRAAQIRMQQKQRIGTQQRKYSYGRK